jgi:hypothetical protein
LAFVLDLGSYVGGWGRRQQVTTYVQRPQPPAGGAY